MSLNVRGLRNRVKRSSIFSFLRDQNGQFYFPQEIFLEQKMKMCGEMNGEVILSFHTVQHIVKVYVS